MECKFKTCLWNRKGICKRKNSLILYYDTDKTNTVRCSKYQNKYKMNNQKNK